CIVVVTHDYEFVCAACDQVTHDYEFVCAACDQVAVLEDGVVSDVLPVRGETLGRIRRAIGIDGRARPL
ncbi:hypothetical protein, partial [Eggerthella sinensis]|uniref:hypothetical protein n=1 Tax=Eggerthella sinensis TaxID=242230 RepID=UPI0022E3EB4A